MEMVVDFPAAVVRLHFPRDPHTSIRPDKGENFALLDAKSKIVHGVNRLLHEGFEHLVDVYDPQAVV
jgi:hypothetical protein